MQEFDDSVENDLAGDVSPRKWRTPELTMFAAESAETIAVPGPEAAFTS